MTTNDLIKELKDIIKVHPEAGEAQVWAYIGNELGAPPDHFKMTYVGYDQHHKPARLKLEE